MPKRPPPNLLEGIRRAPKLEHDDKSDIKGRSKPKDEMEGSFGVGAGMVKIEDADVKMESIENSSNEPGMSGNGVGGTIGARSMIKTEAMGASQEEHPDQVKVDRKPIARRYTSDAKQAASGARSSGTKVKAEVEDECKGGGFSQGKITEKQPVKIDVPKRNIEVDGGESNMVKIKDKQKQDIGEARYNIAQSSSHVEQLIPGDHVLRSTAGVADHSSASLGTANAKDKDELILDDIDPEITNEKPSDSWFNHSRTSIRSCLISGGPLANLAQSHPHLIDLIMDQWSQDVRETPQELAETIVFVNDTKGKHTGSHCVYGTMESFTIFCCRLFRAGYIIENKDVQSEMGRYGIHWDAIQDDALLSAAMNTYATSISYCPTMGTSKKTSSTAGLPTDRWNPRLRKLLSNHYKEGKEKPLMVVGYLAGKAWAWLQDDAGVWIGTRGGVLSMEQKMGKLCVDNEGFGKAIIVKAIKRDPDLDIDIIAEETFRPIVKSLTWTNFERHTYQKWLRSHLLGMASKRSESET